MSRHGEVALPWGDGEYKFRLGYGELRDLQETCDAGPKRIADRLLPYDPARNPHGDNFRVEDVRETIRLGLMGAGKTQAEALALITKFVDRRPLNENRYIAWAILAAVLVGATDEQVGKAEEPETKATDSPMTKSPSQDSTAQAPSSALDRQISTP